MLEIRWATREEINANVPRIYAHIVYEAFIALEGSGRCVGVVSFANDPEDPITGSFLDRAYGRRWAYMDLKPAAAKHGYRLIRSILRCPVVPSSSTHLRLRVQ